MSTAPMIMGINRTQDASITIFDGSRHVCSIQKERLTGKKHDWGKLKDIALYKEHISDLQSKSYDLIVECYSSDNELGQLPLYHQELRESLSLAEDAKILQISHHLAHVYSAFPSSGFSECAIMIMDSIGSAVEHITESYQGARIAGQYEVASFYIFKAGRIECIKKQLWDKNPDVPAGLGNFYYKLTTCLFPGEGNEGKVMGLSAFGTADLMPLPELVVTDGEVTIPEAWLSIFQSDQYLFEKGPCNFQEKADLAARGQRVFENALLTIVSWLSGTAGMKDIVYAGGCALNCVANARLLDAGINLYIPPAPHDGGTSIGCAMYGMLSYYGMDNKFSWQDDYLGPKAETTGIVSLIADSYPALLIDQPGDILNECAKRIANGEVAAIFQGTSEFGPRALGNRSILMDARYSILRFWVNAFIKGREWFRPIAPVVLADEMREYFKISRESPFMLYTSRINEKYKGNFPVIEHHDSSARIQSVTEQNNSFIYNLLKRYKSQTSFGILGNTSFNGMNETIVETLDEALRCFIKHPISFLIVPPYIVSKRNPVPNPLLLSKFQ